MDKKPENDQEGRMLEILAIDSSGMTAGAALLRGDKIAAQYSVNNKKTHSQTLLPMIDEICKSAGQDLDSLDAVAITRGPGSFTGLRIGSATAKGIALVKDIPIIEVDTLEAMAWNFWGFEGMICPMLDARRDQLFAGIYRFENDRIVPVTGQMALSVDEMAARINEQKQKCVIFGDGAVKWKEKFEELLEVPFLYAPAHLQLPRAEALAACAAIYYKEGKTVSSDDHQPEYLRVSQAERVRAQKQGMEN